MKSHGKRSSNTSQHSQSAKQHTPQVLHVPWAYRLAFPVLYCVTLCIWCFPHSLPLQKARLVFGTFTCTTCTHQLQKQPIMETNTKQSNDRGLESMTITKHCADTPPVTHREGDQLSFSQRHISPPNHRNSTSSLKSHDTHHLDKKAASESALLCELCLVWSGGSRMPGRVQHRVAACDIVNLHYPV